MKLINNTIAKVAIERLKFENDVLYSYNIPDGFASSLKEGQRVIVPFGRGNCKRQGVIIEIDRHIEAANLKEIYAVLDEVPLLSVEMIEVVKWVKSHYFCTYYEAIKLIIPKSFGGKIEGTKYVLTPLFNYDILNDEEKSLLNTVLKPGKNYFSVNDIRKSKTKNCNQILDSLLSRNLLTEKLKISEPKKSRLNKALRLSQNKELSDSSLSEKQLKVCEFLRENGTASLKEIRYFLGVSDSIVRALIKKGILEEVVLNNENHDILGCTKEPVEITLSNEQNEVYNKMLCEYKKGNYRVSLLYGVTGSGKTQVILNLIDYVLEIGKSVIFLVPEIALTLQFIGIFTSRYKNKVAVIHSGISDSKKMDTWQKIKNGEVKIVIGARSAIFAPFEDLGMIVIDEEHESTYKSESSPRFDAKEIAKFRCNYNKCMLVLSSATPSIGSYYMAKIGKYSLYELKNRYGNALLPKVEIVDMNGRYNREGEVLFSSELIENIDECLKDGKQVIILLNRRGFNPFVKCINCGEVQMCPYCSISLNYHKSNNRLMCHYCGYSRDFLDKCISCKEGKLLYMGFGTQRAEIQLQGLLPNARILRVDSDTKEIKKNSQEDIIKDFEKGNYDILIGTQIVSKGFNFPNVTLVGILMADQYLYSSDFRSYEKAFSLITQTVGRAGRSKFKGKAIIQTFTPGSEVLKFAASQDYKSFFDTEINIRKLMLNPPFSDVCTVVFRGKNEQKVYDVCLCFFDKIKKTAKEKYNNIPLRIFPPTSAIVKKVAENYRYQIVIKCRNSKKFRDMMTETILSTKSNSRFKDTSIIVDINPVSIL